ncbi:predicted protein [Enterococcus faecium 1,141,733]|nr:predicted protein [Enterococcus faecium 1,141,733]
MALLYEAKKQALGDTKATQWLVHNLLDVGTEKFTESDQKMIEQYVREQQNYDLWDQE